MKRGPSSVAIPVVLNLLLIGAGCEQKTDSTVQNASPIEQKQAKDLRIKSTVTVDVNARRPAMNISEYRLFDGLTTLMPGVIPYELNSVSYVDDGRQQSYLYIPPGKSATYLPEGAFTFPVGTVLIQNIRFSSPEDGPDQLAESRLLIHMTNGWTAVPYIWNADGTDADRIVIGEKTGITRRASVGEPHSFTYFTPNMNECKRCHVNDDVMSPIGVTAANLNRTIDVDGPKTNQLEHWKKIGLLTGLPEDRSTIPRLPNWQSEFETTERRARSWLDVNCSHCHNPRGAASTSGLDLTFEQNQPVRFGVYKPPVAAGRGSQGLNFSILPQRPDESFLVRRIDSTELGIMMPPLGRTTVHYEGVELIRRWISEMDVDEALAEVALNPMKAYKDAVNGGDAERGREIFHKVQKCTACHKVGDEGGSVGPNLSDVGKRTKRDYLLESIVLPSAKIVKGFETHVIVTMEGQVVTGTLQSEDEYEVVLGTAKEETRVKKQDIDERTVSDVSTMPTLANLLSVDDVRNLIAYLATLQESP